MTTAVAETPVKVAVPKTLRRIMPRVMLATVGVQVCSFASSVALARILGANTGTDAYFLGLSVPTIVYGILLGAVRSGSIPALTELSLASDEAFGRASSELISAVLLVASVLAIAVTAVTALTLPLIIGGGQLGSMTRETVIELAPLGLMGAMTGVLGGVLAVRGIFVATTAVMAFEPIFKIAFLLIFGSRIGIHALIAGNLVGSACCVAVLWLLARRHGVRLGWVTPRNSRFVRVVLLTSAPLLVGHSVLQVNPLIDRTMASSLGAGSITVLDLGLRLFLAPAVLLTATMIGPVTATWAATHAERGLPALRASVRRATVAALATVPPLVILGITLRHPLVTLIFKGGAYSPSALNRTAAVFGMLLVGLTPQVLTVLFSALFIVMKQTRYTMKVAMLNVVLNVTLNFALRPVFGIAGIALSTSLTSIVVISVYVAGAQRLWKPLSWEQIRSAVTRTAASTLLIAAAAITLLSMLPTVDSRETGLVAITLVTLSALAIHVLIWISPRSAAVTIRGFLSGTGRVGA
jgi:putative peptidoglycan lipid II flippase